MSSFGIDYPVALDNDFGTWTAWGNRYWPAEYYIDRQGHVRYAHFGEGDYGGDREGHPHAARGKEPARAGLGLDLRQDAGRVADAGDLPRHRPALEPRRLARGRGCEATYTDPQDVPLNDVAYGGRWLVERERIVAGEGARLRLAYHARNVYLVLGKGETDGSVGVAVDGKHVKTVTVAGDRLYTLVTLPGPAADHTLDLSFSPGAEAYAFTFG